MPPGSEVANLAVLGYDVKQVYQGRGVLEAASMGIDLESDDLAMRCNLICLDEQGSSSTTQQVTSRPRSHSSS